MRLATTVAVFLIPVSSLAQQLPMAPDKVAQMAAMVRAQGFNCPDVKRAYAAGQSADGTIVRILCGPADMEAVYEEAIFRVTFQGDNEVLVEPWQ